MTAPPTRSHPQDRSVALAQAAAILTVVPLVIAVYGVVVLGGGHLLGTGGRPSLALSIVATVVVAVSFERLTAQLRHLAARLRHGGKATPYKVMSGFARRMAGTLSVEDVLPATAEAAARVLRADHAEVRLFPIGGAARTAGWTASGGRSSAGQGRFDLVVPVTHSGELVAELAVGKHGGPGPTPADEHLLATLAAHVGPALQNVRLRAELESSLERLGEQAQNLQASRLRIVTARQGERRRLKRVIRSRVERTLHSAALEMRTAEQLCGGEADSARTALERASGLVVEALDALRELAQGVFPPLLAQRGVVRALEANVGASGDRVAVRTAPGLDLDGVGIGAQSAAYFCCVEAAHLSCRRAPGRSVTIELAAAAPNLEFTVRGAGLAFGDGTAQRALQHLIDRLEALGGGLELLQVDERGPGLRGWAPAS